MQIMQMLRLAEAEKNNQKSLGHAMQALLLASRLRNDELQARVYARMSYNYRSQRTPHLYYVDSLAVVSARRSGNDLLLFNAIDAYVRDLLNENKLRQIATLLHQSDSLAGLNDTLQRRADVALLRSADEYKRLRMRPALVFAQTSLKYARMAEAESSIAEALSWIAGCYSNLSRYDSAADHYFQSLDIWKKTGDGSHTARIYSGLGALYKTSGDLSSAISYHRRAFAIFNEENDEIQAAYEQLNIAEVFLRQKKRDSALIILRTADATFRRLNNAQGLLLSSSTFSKYYMFSGNKDSAGHYIRLTQQYLQKSESPSLDYYASAFKVINDIHQGNITEGETGLRKLLVQTKELLPEEMIVNAITKLNLPDMTDTSKILLKNI
ncbi:MAG: tetratricopeptide repeat protein, partial [Chitinophagaceae bacterium]|nr:tetratricopeptide repeat protein [Chitinophagaceae bacterium]